MGPGHNPRLGVRRFKSARPDSDEGEERSPAMEPKKPTLAAIEAALSEYNNTPAVDPTTDELSEDAKQFWTILQQSEELQGTLIGLAGGLASEDIPAGEFDFSHVQELAESGKLNAEFMFKISMVCEQFFWVGWHARGAIEDEDKLSGMLGAENGSESDDVDEDWSET